MPGPDAAVVTIKVSFAVRERGDRKPIFAPDGAPMATAAPHADNTLVKAIARAFRWQKMLKTGRYATIKEMAKAEKIDASYVSRVLRLTLLAPGLVGRIVCGRQHNGLCLDDLMSPFAVWWPEQNPQESTGAEMTFRRPRLAPEYRQQNNDREGDTERQEQYAATHVNLLSLFNARYLISVARESQPRSSPLFRIRVSRASCENWESPSQQI
jgi:hypothetical protein